MGIDEKLSMDEARERLTRLRDDLPGRDEIWYDFASALAGRLNGPLSPRGFFHVADRCLRYVPSSSDQALSPLASYSPRELALATIYIGSLAAIAVSEPFGSNVDEVARAYLSER